jgi:hypothetical protein
MAHKLDGPARIARDRANDVQAPIGIRRWRNPAGHRVEAHQTGRKAPDYCRGQHREAAHAREHEGAARAGLGLEARNTADEIGAIGEIEIVDAKCERCLDHAIGFGPIGLERPARINHEVWGDRAQLRSDGTVAIESKRAPTWRSPAGLRRRRGPWRASGRQ